MYRYVYTYIYICVYKATNKHNWGILGAPPSGGSEK